jgi:hypothetical protein
VSAFVLIGTQVGAASEVRKRLEEKEMEVSLLFGRFDLIAKLEALKDLPGMRRTKRGSFPFQVVDKENSHQALKDLSDEINEKIRSEEKVVTTETLIDYSHISEYWNALEISGSQVSPQDNQPAQPAGKQIKETDTGGEALQNQESPYQMPRCHILITAKPGSDEDIENIFRGSLKPTLESKELGDARAENTELIPVFGRYDFIIHFNYKTFDDMAKHVLIVRSGLKEYITETVTLCPRGGRIM